MRIDAYNQISQIYNAQTPVKTQKAKGTAWGSDQLSISQAGRDFQVAKNAVAEASDVREDKIAKIKSMVDSGKYQVDTSDFASKLLERYHGIAL